MTKPSIERNGKPHLGAIQNVIRDDPTVGASQQPFLTGESGLMARWKGCSELHHLHVKQRRPGFERASHRRDIDLDEQITREVSAYVYLKESVEHFSTRRAPPWSAKRLPGACRIHIVAEVLIENVLALQKVEDRD